MADNEAVAGVEKKVEAASLQDVPLDAEGKPLTKSALKKLEKDRKKAELKAAKAAKVAAQQAAATVPVPVITLDAGFEPTGGAYGKLPLVQSAGRSKRVWTKLHQLSAAMEGQEVWMRARVHVNRGSGSTSFLILRDGFVTVQAVAFKSDEVPKPMIKWINALTKESVIDVFGKVQLVPKPLNTASIKDAEISMHRVYLVSAPSMEQLPFQLADASRSQQELDADPALVKVNQDVRLDNRVLDLRTTANHALMRVSSGVCTLFREYLGSKGFTEIHTPKLISAASEGGAEVFEVGYFDRKAYLAQSPQLYKQMAISADLDRVMEIGPVFRAENTNTRRHMTEFVGLDMEMTINEHYSEVLEVLGGMFIHVFKGLNERYARELEAIREQYPSEPLLFSDEPLVLTYAEGIDMLTAAKAAQPEVDFGEFDLHDDLSTTAEKQLGRLVREKYNTDFYILDRYPEEARPFYTMLAPDDPRFTNSYDVFIRGQEVVSGAQRIHDPKLLMERATAKGVPHAGIQQYIDAFHLACRPHGGAGIGLERVVFLFCGLDSIFKSSMFPRTPSRLTP